MPFAGAGSKATLEPSQIDLTAPTYYGAMAKWLADTKEMRDSGVLPWDAARQVAYPPVGTPPPVLQSKKPDNAKTAVGDKGSITNVTVKSSTQGSKPPVIADQESSQLKPTAPAEEPTPTEEPSIRIMSPWWVWVVVGGVVLVLGVGVWVVRRRRLRI